MKLKIVEQRVYENKKKIQLILEKELPIRWFGGKVLIDGKEINVERSKIFADRIETKEIDDYVGKYIELDDKYLKYMP